MKSSLLARPQPLKLRQSRQTRRPGRQSALCAQCSKQSYYLGLDFGTSGARATVIDGDGVEVAGSKQGYQKTETVPWNVAWESALGELISALPTEIVGCISSVAFDGTSATTLLLDRLTGQVLADPKLYNESQSEASVKRAQELAPEGHPARASTSTLCKVLEWDSQNLWQKFKTEGKVPCILHQADWLAGLLHGDLSCSDYTNSLKLGYDPETEEYPPWLAKQTFSCLFPERVVAPGSTVGHVTETSSQKFGLPTGCAVAAGVTDSIAAVIASGVKQEGEAVSSLGSTLAIKLLSSKRVDDVNYGIYSHRLGDVWLVGGASNSGGVVLRQFFTDEQLRDLTPDINPDVNTGLNYYPLPSTGERFPINDPKLQPKLEPRHENDAVFLQGIFEGIAAIESRGYELLDQLGAGKVKRVVTAGGGAANPKWTQIRANMLGVPVESAENVDASYGAALLARQAILGK